MSFFPDNQANQGQLIASSSVEAVDGQIAARSESQGRFRSAGWWPEGGTVLKVLGLAFLVIVGIGWALTLLN